MDSKKMLNEARLQKLEMSIKKDIVGMIFKGEEKGDVDFLLKSLTTPQLRKKFKNRSIVWRNGNFRLPHINKSTGVVGLYNSSDVQDLSSNKVLLEAMKKKYQSDDLVMAHGPPAPIVKPANSCRSSPFIYHFQDLSSDLKHTGVLCVSSHQKEREGNLELLENFELYYEILNKYYNFDKHISPAKDVFYLEDWFSLEEANDVIEEYIVWYNYYERDIPCTLSRDIRWKVGQIYDEHKIRAPEDFKRMTWKTLDSQPGEFYIFSSRQVLRTTRNVASGKARIYIQFAFEKRPQDWDQSERKAILDRYYETGRFGDWASPGKRAFITENSTEHSYRRCKNGDIQQQ